MKITPIRSNWDYGQAMQEIGRLMAKDIDGDGKHLTEEESDRLSILGSLASEWERRDSEIGSYSLIDAINFRMDQLSMKRVDLAREMGLHPCNVTTILKGRKPLSAKNVVKLHLILDIPYAVLLEENKVQLQEPPKPEYPILSRAECFDIIRDHGLTPSMIALQSGFHRRYVQTWRDGKRDSLKIRSYITFYAIAKGWITR